MPPLGLGFAAAWYRSQGHDVDIMDCVAGGYANVLTFDYGMYKGMQRYGNMPDEIYFSAYDIVGFTVLFSNQVWMVRGLARQALDQDAWPVIGGLHPSLYPQDFLGFEVVHGPDITTCSPDFDGFPIEQYFHINVPFSPVPKGKRAMPVLASIGCPVGCAFCANTNRWPKWVSRLDRAISEMEFYKRNYGADEFQFADDNLIWNKKQTRELCNAMDKLGVQWCTPNGLMVNRLNEKTLKMMADSGCYQITLSVDGGNKRTLKRMGKPVKLDKVGRLTDYARQLGMYTHGTVVVGMPGETAEETQDALDWVWDNTDFTSISVFCAARIPGSRLYNEGGKGQDDWMIDTTAGVASNAARDFQDIYTARARARHGREVREKYGGVDVSGRLV